MLAHQHGLTLSQVSSLLYCQKSQVPNKIAVIDVTKVGLYINDIMEVSIMLWFCWVILKSAG